jgi:hypothetical protein
MERESLLDIERPKKLLLIGFALIVFPLAFFGTGCVSKRRYHKSIDEAYVRGGDAQRVKDEVALQRMQDENTALRAQAAKRTPCPDQPRDAAGRFIKVNGVLVDRDGK